MEEPHLWSSIILVEVLSYITQREKKSNSSASCVHVPVRQSTFNLNLALANIFWKRLLHACSVKGLPGPFPVCCEPQFFLSLFCGSRYVPQPKSRWDDSRSTETSQLGALMWSNECACDLCSFYGSMAQRDGRGKFNGKRVALTPLMMVKKAWGSTSPSIGTQMLHCWMAETAGRWISESLPS